MNKENSSAIPSKMYGYVSTGYNFTNPERTIQFKSDIDVPKITKDDEVLVKLKNSAMNPADYKVNQGIAKLFLKLSFPHVVGKDGSGEVVAVGSNVKKFKIGDSVLGYKESTSGTFGQYCTFEEKELTKKPDFLSFERAAAIPLAGGTALTGFNNVVKYPAKKDNYLKRVLIIGASGGTGSYGVFLAKHFFKAGKVYAVCSTDNIEYVRSLGADRVIDYKKEDFVKVLQNEKENDKFDGAHVTFVLDCVGGWDVMQKSMSIMDSNGLFETLALDESVEKNPSLLSFVGAGSRLIWRKMMTNFKRQPKICLTMAVSNGDKLEGMLSEISKDKDLILALEKVRLNKMKFDQVVEAFTKQGSKRTVGKIVFDNEMESSPVEKL